MPRHQCFRRVFVTSANALISALNLRPGSTAASLVSLFVPFVLSAAQHAYAIRVMGGPGYGTKTSAFFLLQPCGILLESLVRKPFSRTKSMSIWTRLMGHLWVLSWMLSCGHLFFDELVQVSTRSPLTLVDAMNTTMLTTWFTGWNVGSEPCPIQRRQRIDERRMVGTMRGAGPKSSMRNRKGIREYLWV